MEDTKKDNNNEEIDIKNSSAIENDHVETFPSNESDQLDESGIEIETSQPPVADPVAELETSQPPPNQNNEDQLVSDIKNEFDTLLNELGEDEHKEKFKAEYFKLLSSFEQAKLNESELGKKCENLQLEIVGQTSQVQNAMKLAQNDRNTISNLKRDIKKAWEMVEEAKDREEKTRETIQQLRAEISVLQNALQQTQDNEVGNAQTLSELSRQKEELTKERDMQLNQIIQLRSEISDMADKIKVMEQQKSRTEDEIQSLCSTISSKKNEVEKEIKNRDKLERELKDAKITIDEKNNEIKSKQETVLRLKDEVSRLEIQMKEQKVIIEKTSKEQEQLLMKAAKLQQDYEDQLIATNHLLNENESKSEELKEREEDLAHLRTDLKSVNRLKEGLQKKLKQLEDQKKQVELERDQMNAVNHSVEKDIELYKKLLEQEKRQVEELTRERDIINKTLEKSASSTSKQQTLIKIQEQSKRNLEADISSYKEEATKQRKIIFSLEKERDKFIQDATNVQEQLLQTVEDLKLRENEISEGKKKISEVETKLKQQQNLYEAVRADRNTYSKNLIEAQDEINEMRQKLKVISHQIDQLKEEIHSKDNLIAKHHQEYQKSEKERENLKTELQRLKKQSEMTEQYYQNQQVEEQKLRALVHEAEVESSRQKKEIEHIVQERDMINSQLSRRNEEISLLYEKIKIQTSILGKAETQFRERVEDTRVLKLELEKIRHEKMAIQKEVVEIEKFKADVVRLEKEVMREKSRVKVLDEQLQNPVNVHRWRKLEGIEPDRFELIQKIQTLQKRLIAKTEEVIEKELLIQQKEKMYEELKIILARQPGPEVMEHLNQCQQTVREKNAQLKSMVSELQMYQSQVGQYKFEIERLNREIANIKKLYYEQKKKQMVNHSSGKRIGKSGANAKKTTQEALDLAFNGHVDLVHQ